jgi:hypothetical protein
MHFPEALSDEPPVGRIRESGPHPSALFIGLCLTKESFEAKGPRPTLERPLIGSQ